MDVKEDTHQAHGRIFLKLALFLAICMDLIMDAKITSLKVVDQNVHKQLQPLQHVVMNVELDTMFLTVMI